MLFQRLGDGDTSAESQLFDHFYDELKRVAQAKLSNWERGAEHTLQPTALVGELYIRLTAGADLASIESRRHFFGIASRALERILIEHYRQRSALKRGGDRVRVCLDDVLDALQASQTIDVEALHDAIKQLESISRFQADIVRRKFFAGQRHAEIAEQLECPLSRVESHWRVARAWLRRELREET